MVVVLVAVVLLWLWWRLGDEPESLFEMYKKNHHTTIKQPPFHHRTLRPGFSCRS